ncbi:nucleoside diphosphate kinase 6 isoform X1 [Brevipalpus obovatus]|uniref:nucleoside diphosphate kinase 6 isoform X1 n=1 Tax=Brevipalpus obovatus TaxID=246614 RepID=UPI003D9E4E49
MRKDSTLSMKKGKFFHGRLISFITSGPLWAHILARPDAIKTWRNLMGPTKVFKAIYEAPESIRGKFGLSDTRNAVHGSDSEETAFREMQFFFPEFSQHDWRTQEEPRFQHPECIHFDPDQCVHTLSKPLENSNVR